MGMTMSIMTHRLNIAVSFWVLLNIAFHYTKETPVCPFENFSEASGPEIIILEKFMLFRTVTSVIKALSQDYL